MSIFQDVVLQWQGEEYIVKSNKVMMLIAKIEDVITLQELTQESGPRLARVSEAYAVALNYVDCHVSIEEVYSYLFGEGGGNVKATITGLIMLMLPPDTYNPEANGGGNQKATKKPRATKKAV